MSTRIDQKTPGATITIGDILYLLHGNLDISLDAYTAIRALVGLAVGKSFTFDGMTGTRLEMDGVTASVLRGLTAAWVSTTSFSIATGFIADSTFADTLALRTALTKTTSAWSVGTAAGGLDTGSIAANTWYAVYLIKRPDTGIVDILFSTNGTTPTALPANYTLYRRIAWVLTNGSSQFVKFSQSSRRFLWDAKVRDVNETPPSTNRILKTVSCPPNTEGIFVFRAICSSSMFLDAGWTALADAAASNTNFILRATSSAGEATVSMNQPVDASKQIYYRVDVATGTTVSVVTAGWIDIL